MIRKTQYTQIHTTWRVKISSDPPYHQHDLLLSPQSQKRGVKIMKSKTSRKKKKRGGRRRRRSLYGSSCLALTLAHVVAIWKKKKQEETGRWARPGAFCMGRGATSWHPRLFDGWTKQTGRQAPPTPDANSHWNGEGKNLFFFFLFPPMRFSI